MNSLNEIAKSLDRENIYPEGYLEALLDNLSTEMYLNHILMKTIAELLWEN